MNNVGFGLAVQVAGNDFISGIPSLRRIESRHRQYLSRGGVSPNIGICAQINRVPKPYKTQCLVMAASGSTISTRKSTKTQISRFLDLLYKLRSHVSKNNEKTNINFQFLGHSRNVTGVAIIGSALHTPSVPDIGSRIELKSISRTKRIEARHRFHNRAELDKPYQTNSGKT